MPGAAEAGTRVLLRGYERVVRPVLFRYGGGDPEVVHERMIADLAAVPPALWEPLRRVTAGPRRVEVAGITFPNRVGLAAGLDKNGLAARSWAGLGFGHAELGTVTPRPQPGNDKPRLFRLPASKAVINRMGFNNDGASALAERLEEWGQRRGSNALGIPIGVSIGKNKLTPLGRALEDYLACVERLSGLADYFAVNVSSPNTPGLRQLQDAEPLGALIAAIASSAGSAGRPTPVFVKGAPDLDDGGLDAFVATCEDAGAAGLILTNTTLARTGLAPSDQSRAAEAGGLSGAPLTARSLAVVERAAQRTALPVIGVGGIMTPRDAARMFDAGAALVQIYTGFIYAGPALIRGINRLPDWSAS